MIKFSNGRSATYFIASGAMAFDGKGWPWERPLVKLGLIKPNLFATTLKSLTLHPRKGNLRWHKPWECVRLIEGGAVNKVGLTNPGFEFWERYIAPTIDFENLNIVVSLFGTLEELEIMVNRLATYRLLAIEINVSCPNTGHANEETDQILKAMQRLYRISHHPLILKISALQEGVVLASELKSVVDAISFNTMPWHKVFPNIPSPLAKLEIRVGGGGGGVSGIPLQEINWRFMRQIFIKAPCMQLITSSIMKFTDLRTTACYGATGFSFGTIHLPTKGRSWTLFTNPLKPTQIVERQRTMIEQQMTELSMQAKSNAPQA